MEILLHVLLRSQANSYRRSSRQFRRTFVSGSAKVSARNFILHRTTAACEYVLELRHFVLRSFHYFRSNVQFMFSLLWLSHKIFSAIPSSDVFNKIVTALREECSGLPRIFKFIYEPTPNKQKSFSNMSLDSPNPLLLCLCFRFSAISILMFCFSAIYLRVSIIC